MMSYEQYEQDWHLFPARIESCPWAANMQFIHFPLADRMSSFFDSDSVCPAERMPLGLPLQASSVSAGTLSLSLPGLLTLLLIGMQGFAGAK